MKNTLAIAWKEAKGYFGQPLAYVIASMFLFITGFFFVDGLSDPLPLASIRGYVGDIRWILFLLAMGAILTMRLLAEEQKLGTIELLLTNPVRDPEVILGKYLASVLFFFSMLVLSIFFPFLLFLFADPDAGPVLTSYLGIILLGLFALAVGLFSSSLTNNQIVAIVVTMGVLFIFWFIYLATDFLGGTLADFVDFVALQNHYGDFARGIIDTKAVIYFVSMTLTFLVLAMLSLSSRRWR